MLAGGRGLPTVGPLARDDVHLVIFRTAHNVGRDLGDGRWGGVETTATDATAILIPANAITIIEWCDDAWELDADISTILEGGAVVASTALPLVRTVGVDIELLATVEKVATCETDLGLRTISPIAATNGIALEIEVIWFVEHTVQAHIKGISTCTGCKLEIGR